MDEQLHIFLHIDAEVIFPYIVIYTAIIYPASENSVKAEFPSEIKAGVKQAASKLKESKHLQNVAEGGLHVLSPAHTSDLITLRPRLQCTRQLLNGINFPRERGDTLFK